MATWEADGAGAHSCDVWAVGRLCWGCSLIPSCLPCASLHPKTGQAPPQKPTDKALFFQPKMIVKKNLHFLLFRGKNSKLV